VISSAVFARYARSLADVALESGEADAVAADLTVYREIVRAAPALLEIFDSPAVSREAKQNLIAALLEKYPVRQITANFLRVLIDHNRVRYFDAIVDLYVATVNRRKGVVAADVTSPIPLSDADVAVLRESLAKATGANVMVNLRTDPGLIGGLVVQIESTVFDGSVRRQLTEVKRRLLEA
jgi:F-type H+-transporting ATPase subunit delta